MDIIFLTFILVLSIFLGFELISKVPATLHTPLMSVTNAISSVIIVGALVAIGADVVADDQAGQMTRWLGFAAVVLASINIFGGFLVTQRMLAMYRKKDK